MLGKKLFDETLVSSLRNSYQFEVPEDLDVFETLLFFFMFNQKLTPSKFLKFFCRIDKVKELKGRKDFYLEIFNTALNKIKQIRFDGTPIFFNFRKKDYFIEFDISIQAQKLQKIFNAEIQGKDFWIEKHKLGINIAYLGAFLYLLGVCGKEEIDLKHLDNILLLTRFKQFGIDTGEWRNNKIVRSLVIKLASHKVFKHGKLLTDYHDYILKVKSISPPVKALEYHEQKEDIIVHKERITSWAGGVPTKVENIVHDFSIDRERLERSISHLNNQNMDIRYEGVQLPNQTHLEYNDSKLSHLLKFDCPVSKIKRKDWSNVTFGEESCAVIEIEHLQTMYLNSCLKRKKDKNTFSNMLLDKTNSSFHGLMYDIALDAMFQYGDTPKRARQSFRARYHKYTKQGATKREINSFFYFLTEREFQIRKRVKKFISYDKYLKKGFQTFLGVVLRLHSPIPMIVTNNAIIVPESNITEVLYALSESYRANFGDKRLVTFKVTTKQAKEKYRFINNNKMKEVTK